MSPEGDAGGWPHPTQPECVVQCCGVGEEERWRPMVLHQFLPSQCPDEKRLLPFAKNP